MKETLHIKNFGPIKDVKLELGKVNVLIGDQGTGKSTVAKIYSLINTFIYFELFKDDKIDQDQSLQWQFEGYLKLFEIENYLKKDTFLFFENNIAKVKFENNIITKEFIGEKPSIYKIILSTYIVAERLFVSTLSDALYGLNQLGTKLPVLFNKFGNLYSSARKEQAKRNYNEILGVEFSHINGVDSVSVNDRFIPLTDASSGIQGTIPLLVVFDKLLERGSGRLDSFKTNNLIIEEPELNLFPTTQQKLIKYIIGNNFYEDQHWFIDTETNEEDFDLEYTRYKNQLLLTTHSPYILTSLNNLMYAYTVGQKHKDEVGKIIPEKYWLNPSDVSAYMLVYDEEQGGCVQKNILSDEDGLIDSVQIDGVSDILSEEFNNIMAIKLRV